MTSDPAQHPPTDARPNATDRSLRRFAALAIPALLVGCTASGTSSGSDGQSAADSPEVIAASLTRIELADLLANGPTLDGSGNNVSDPTVGQAGLIYPRETAANYADGIGEPVASPDARYLSNRIFNDVNQNIFSENDVTHWSFVWGQFIDHTIGLRESGEEDFSIAFDPDDPLEDFTNDLGGISMSRSAIATDTGDDSPREQLNTISSYIDAWAVYGGTDERLDWLRDGTVDGDPTNNEATLLDVDGYLPTAEARPDVEAPDADLMGRLFANPTEAVIAGDVRANENIGLTAVQTLFLREHNRIVELLPDDLDEETKFDIARRVVAAEQQNITYNEFLPAMGVDLSTYEGYNSTVDPSITNEFATVGYRAHSAIHGEYEAEIDRATITDDEIAALEAGGVEVAIDDDVIEVAVPLNVAFGNPSLLVDLGLGNVLAGLGSEAAYANDEQIDNQLRSVLFQVPGPLASGGEVENPLDCLDGTEIAGCFSGVNDLGALDVMRGYDHGMATYNDVREAYGLVRIDTFAELTGESTEEFPNDPAIDAADPIDDPDILDFVSLADGDGNAIDPDSDLAGTAVLDAERRTTTAARLKAIFGTVDAVDAFTGMVSEPHVAGTEFGELQLAMWTRQFSALRDGDRFFYGNDPVLDAIATEFDIDFRNSLADLIVANTDADSADIAENVFLLDEAPALVPTPTPSEQSGDAATDDETALGDDDPQQRRGDDQRRRPRHDRGDAAGNQRRDT